MMILFVVLSFVMVFILIWQQIQHKKLVREIDYITSRLDTISVISENGFVLIPTDNDSIKKLSAALNKLLQDFYTKKSQFEQSKQAMAKVLTNISHDIRTPLTVLKGNSEMLSNITNTYSASENVHAMAVKIDQKADDLISTINDYFTMSKITSGDFSIKMKKENISRICQDTILDYYDLLEQKQFEVNIQIPDTPIFAYTDNEALQRILKNLIDNAIRHGGDGKYISLRLITSNGKNIIEIEDRGDGISPQQQKQIFERNYTTARKTSGSGLGLSISKCLAEQIGADLEVYSVQNEQTLENREIYDREKRSPFCIMAAIKEAHKMDYIMETVGLRKAYKDNIVVDDVNMHISKGAIYGFVGPNGAGKSTVMKMILSLIQPDAGEVQLLGEKVTSHSYEIFKKVGSIIENQYFYDKMTARQNLELHCEYMGFPNKERIDEVLHLVDLQNVEKKQVCHYSLGMKQRLAIARAILAKPEFLILDEPINALDPEGIREMRTLFQRLNQEDGTTIFISSHILSEVDLLADTIGIIQHGKLLTELPIEEIHKHQTDYISLQVDDVTRVAALLENMRITNFSVLDKEFIHIYDSDISGKALSKAIIENGIGLESMGRKQDTLEDFFFQLTEEEK